VVGAEVVGVVVGHRLGLDVASLDGLAVDDAGNLEGGLRDHLLDGGFEAGAVG
jgi:hypothetical protein